MAAVRYDFQAPLRPVAPQVTVFSTFGSLPDPDPASWISGIEFNAQECVTTYSFPYCDDEADPLPSTTVQSAEGGLERFEPFRVYASTTCESVLPAEDPEFVSLVEQRLEAAISYQIARQLWTGQIDETILNLQEAGQLAVAEADFENSVEWGVGTLLQRYADAAKQGAHRLHAPPALLPYLVNLGLATRDGDRFIDPYGEPFAILQGYPGGAESDTTSPATWNATAFGPALDEDGTANNEGGAVGVAPFGQATTGANWMFVTGQVEVAMRPIRVQPESFVVREHGRTNTYTVYADTDAIYRFDPCAVFAVRVPNPVS